MKSLHIILLIILLTFPCLSSGFDYFVDMVLADQAIVAVFTLNFSSVIFILDKILQFLAPGYYFSGMGICYVGQF